MEKSEWRLRALSPLDGRYGKQMEPYAAAFSEASADQGTLCRRGGVARVFGGASRAQ